MAVDAMPSYKPFKALNRNVIQPAMSEVNKLSNIQVEMETRVDERQPSWPVPTTTLAGGAGRKTGMPVWRAAPPA
jgi:hypothetical protein